VTASLPTTHTPEATFDQRIRALDGIRGLALIQVLLIHFAILNEVPETTVVDKVVGQVWDAGWIAMDSFFVLSGFLITGILYEAKSAKIRHYFRNFYVRRSLRIFPAHYVYLLALLILLPFIMPEEKRAIEAIRQDWWWFATYLGNIRLVLDYGRRPDVFFTSHLWSLSVEEQFYLVWPVVVLLLGRAKLMVFCVFISLVALFTRIGMVLAGVNAWVPYELTLTRMDSLAIGALVAIAVRDPHDLLWLKRWFPQIAVVSAALIAIPALILGELYLFGDWEIAIVHTPLSVLYGLLIFYFVTGVRGGKLERAFSQPFLVRLGRYSYAMYLWHLAVAYFLFANFSIGTHVPTLFGSHLPGAITFAVAAFIPTYIIGWLSWNFIEAPALGLKRHFPYTAGETAARHNASEPASPPSAAPASARGD